MNGSEGYIGASRQPFVGYMLTLSATVSILPAYRVYHAGYTYAVLAGNEDQSNLIVQRVEVERV
jgi:hypothetical protein